jgi:hypothetical protein
MFDNFYQKFRKETFDLNSIIFALIFPGSFLLFTRGRGFWFSDVAALKFRFITDVMQYSTQGCHTNCLCSKRMEQWEEWEPIDGRRSMRDSVMS